MIEPASDIHAERRLVSVLMSARLLTPAPQVNRRVRVRTNQEGPPCGGPSIATSPMGAQLKRSTSIASP
jgi:hypothetical protein